MQIYGIASFTKAVFTPQVSKAGGDPKYRIGVLIPPSDPQVATISAEFNRAVADSFPNGMPRNTDVCWGTYDDFFFGKEYYDPRFKGWYYFKCSATADQKPAVVHFPSLQPILDPAKVYGGAMVWVHANMTGYTKGSGGIGGWLNGICVTDEEPKMGRLDNKPSVEQMFANLPGSHQTHLAAGALPVQAPNLQHVAANGAVVTPPGVTAPPPPVPAKPVLLMKPGEAAYEAYIAAGWTDDLLIAHGKATRPSFV